MNGDNTIKGNSLAGILLALTVIGLLLGGALHGRELMENSRVTNAIRQVQGFDAATASFRDLYGSWPGDLKKPFLIPECHDDCNVPGNGNGLVGDIRHSLKIARYLPKNNDETRVYWVQLAAAKLIDSIDASARLKGAPQWGVHMPAAATRGGFAIQALGVKATHVYPDLGGNYFALLLNPSEASYVLRPAQAALMDSKMDDGIATSGDVIGWGSKDCLQAMNYNTAAYAPHACNVYINIPE